MAASLGTLTLDLIAKISGFVGPLEKATTATKKQTADMRKAFDDWAKGIGTAVGAAAASIPAITAALVTQTALAAKEIVNLSNLAGLSTTEFQKYAAAAASVGIEQDKLSDIFKDTNDKIGDFLATGGGELQNFFETIAPKVGVTADQFRKLNSADALQLYVSSLEKANVSQAQMTFFMEAIADEATALVPLLADGGKKFRELGEAAQATGMILDDTTIASAKEFNNQLTIIGQYATAAKTALAAEFMPVLAQLAKDLADTSKEAGGLQKQIKSLADDMVEVVAVLASTTDGIGRTFKVVAGGLASGFATTMAYLTSLGATANTVLSKITFGDMSADFAKNAEKMTSDAKDFARTGNTIALELADSFKAPFAGDVIRDYVKQARQAAKDLPKLDTPGGTGGFVGQTKAQQEAAKAAEAASKKINSAFASQEENLKRQIELINTTTDKRKEATEVAKLQFEIESGRLVGINSEQQKRLEGLAAELDSLKQLKQAEEDRIKLEAFASTLQRENQTARTGFESELTGQGQGDKLRERLQADLAIQQEFNDKFTALRDQFNGGEITKELFDQETNQLEEALAERMVLQQDYYNQLDELQGDWLLGVQEAWANYRDMATDFNQQAAEATSSILNSTTDSIASNITDAVLSTQSLGEAFKNIGKTFATTVIQMGIRWAAMQAIQAGLNAFTSTAAIPIVGPLAAPAAAASALAFAGGLSSQIAGMAHDGIDSVPQDGTWLLQKGERVTTAETSAKLDNTLDNIRKGDSQRAGNTVVNMYEDPNKAGQVEETEDEKGQRMINVWVADLLGDGPSAEAVSRKFGLRSQGQ